MNEAAVILAAGKGTRMCSKIPKVLHKICGSTMISCVIDAAQEAGIQKLVIVAGSGAEQVAMEVSDKCEVALQEQQLGTAHALLQAEPRLSGFSGNVLVLCGDTPLIQGETLRQLVKTHQSSGSAATVLTARMTDPTGYGRIIRDVNGFVSKIVEQLDATQDELPVNEVNTGIYCFDITGLFDALRQIAPANAQGEYYLTDIVGIYINNGRTVSALEVQNPKETAGINDRKQLAEADNYMRMLMLDRLMENGVTLIDPNSTFVSRKVRVGRDTVIQPFTIIEGDSVIGEDCVLGPGSRIVNTIIGKGVSIQNSIALDSNIADGCNIGPFAYLRPGSHLGIGVKIGDFVEIKKSVIGNGSKIPHLSYIGDAFIGKKANIGAGTITCNYDGSKKWLTRINDGAFIGSNTSLVAPVEIGKSAVIGAGSTITKDVADGALGVERAKQTVINAWADKKKLK
ncbi:MAG: bifunctional UDP-N-acetylglucosamine diphosphorylase/glucosamine-1-phosphate N-acetyltransferase GlmU [Peptococcaceae bacterium]|nr:bifunctional UDP-N-acetylglucosamine diphosphorylase/glucosamine-1-phosphate N-acetyltransferase GlmU [Peptococcaceae bacterium]